MKLSGKRALITGANQGFGLAVAKAFVREGARVMLCARGKNRLVQARAELLAAHPNARVSAEAADISSPSDVKRVVDASLNELGGLDILIANAGVHGPLGPFEEGDFDAWRQAIEINLIGTAACCHAVIPILKRQKHGKIVLLSGGGATKPMAFYTAYAASKAAVVRLGETLAVELRDFNIDVNSVAPGAMNTQMFEDALAAGPQKIGQANYDLLLKQKQSGGVPPEKSAELCVFLSSDASNGITGRLISAVWDPWERLPELSTQLSASDIYTLRRIVPGDRGKDWGEQK
jgi:3-oxoacyl-[acyl-carrier protein] reductase